MTTPTSRRSRFLAGLRLLGLSATGLSACQKPVSEAPVRIGYSAWPGWFPLKESEDKGLFTKAGVPVTLQ